MNFFRCTRREGVGFRLAVEKTYRFWLNDSIRYIWVMDSFFNGMLYGRVFAFARELSGKEQNVVYDENQEFSTGYKKFLYFYQ